MKQLTFEYKHYLLTLITLVGVLNYLDRYVLALLLEPIKQDLKLSDSQLGFLTGFAFALFYAVAGIPLARWADSGNRNWVVTCTTGLWSVMVALCGMAGSYPQLLMARVGVAIGEAGCMPVAQSLIADYFDRNERPGAMAIYAMFGSIAIIVGYLLGGWLGESIGWRYTFVVIGLPGIAVAVLVRITLREPRLLSEQKVSAPTPSFKTVFNTLSCQKSFRHLFPGFCIAFFFNMGIYQWMPTFFVRSHAMEIGEVGVWLALTSGVMGILGAYCGGWLATRYARGNEALQMRAVACSLCLSGCIFTLGYWVPNKYIALACIAMVSALFGMGNGPILSVIQSLTHERMRAVALAVLFLFANLIGFGMGPWIAGVLSDALVPVFDHHSLRYALIILSPGYLWVAYHYWMVSKTVQADIQAVEIAQKAITSTPMTKSPAIRVGV